MELQQQQQGQESYRSAVTRRQVGLNGSVTCTRVTPPLSASSHKARLDTGRTRRSDRLERASAGQRCLPACPPVPRRPACLTLPPHTQYPHTTPLLTPTLSRSVTTFLHRRSKEQTAARTDRPLVTAQTIASVTTATNSHNQPILHAQIQHLQNIRRCLQPRIRQASGQRRPAARPLVALVQPQWRLTPPVLPVARRRQGQRRQRKTVTDRPCPRNATQSFQQTRFQSSSK